MTNEFRDNVSLKFCVAISHSMPAENDNKNSVQTKASIRIDKSPADLLLFIAEVAEIVYGVFPLPEFSFPKSVVRACADQVKTELLEYIDELDIEDRLVLYWASILRVMSIFRSSKHEYALSEAEIEVVGKTFEALKEYAVNYNLHTYNHVKEYIDGKL